MEKPQPQKLWLRSAGPAAIRREIAAGGSFMQRRPSELTPQLLLEAEKTSHGTVRIPDRATQERINAAGVEAYHAAVEQLVARAQAVRPAPIKEQMAEAAKQAGKENAARPAPAKAKEARNDR